MFIEGQGCKHPDILNRPHFQSVTFHHSAESYMLFHEKDNERRTAAKYSKLPQNWKEITGIGRLEAWQVRLLPLHPKYLSLLETLDPITRLDLKNKILDEAVKNYIEDEWHKPIEFPKDEDSW